jgi:hypothetical protein
MQTATDHRFTSIQEAQRFALAGNAVITLQSLRSGTHFTYKISSPNAEKQEKRGYSAEEIWFVKLLTSGSADSGDFTYLGMIKKQVSGPEFTLTRASKANEQSPSVKAFKFFMRSRELNPELVIRHENHCGRCGRTLTEPESIDLGYGPECRQLLGL